MRPLPLPSTSRAFWELIESAGCPADAGVAVGVSAATGRRWFADSGGVKPRATDVGPRRRLPRLSFEEREEISVGVAAQESVRHIARRLGRAPSTISREIKRNSRPGRNHYRPQYRFGARWRGGPLRRPQYRASTAQARSQRRACRPKRVSWQAASGCAGRCRLGWTSNTARSRSRCGCGWTFPTIRRCGCRTRRSTSRSTCRDVANYDVSCTGACVPGGPCVDLNDG